MTTEEFHHVNKLTESQHSNLYGTVAMVAYLVRKVNPESPWPNMATTILVMRESLWYGSGEYDGLSTRLAKRGPLALGQLTLTSEPAAIVKSLTKTVPLSHSNLGER